MSFCGQAEREEMSRSAQAFNDAIIANTLRETYAGNVRHPHDYSLKLFQHGIELAERQMNLVRENGRLMIKEWVDFSFKYPPNRPYVELMKLMIRSRRDHKLGSGLPEMPSGVDRTLQEVYNKLFSTSRLGCTG